jgi:rubrerythrin
MKSIEIALKMETDVVKFYTEAAQKVSHTVGKKCFLQLQKMKKSY